MTAIKATALGMLSAALMLGASLASAQDLQTVRLGVDAYTTGSQIWVAKDKGYFEEHGVDAQITVFATGVEAVDALIVGREDMSVGLDFPVISRVREDNVTILSALFRSTPGFHKLVVSNDIQSAADLVGKKIGIATGTAEHLVTLRYLEENGISEDQVEIVGFTSLMEIVASLRSGRIDASFVWADGTDRAIDGGRHYVLTDDSAANRSGSAYLAASTAFVTANPDATVGVLKALDQASSFITENPDEAAAIIAKGTRAPAETVRGLLDFNEFALALTEYERTGFQEVADFLAKTRNTPIEFSVAVDPSFLERAAPDNVQLSD